MDWVSLYQQSQSFVSFARGSAIMGLVIFGGVGAVGMCIAFFQLIKQTRKDQETNPNPSGIQKVKRYLPWIGATFGTLFGIVFIGAQFYNVNATHSTLQVLEGTITGRHTRDYRGTQYFVDIKVKRSHTFGPKGKIATHPGAKKQSFSLRVLKSIYQAARPGKSITGVTLSSSTVGIVIGKKLIVSPNN